MGHDDIIVKYDKRKCFAGLLGATLVVSLVWILPLLDGGYPGFQHQAEGLSDFLWPVAAIATPVAGFIILRIARFAFGDKPAVLLTNRELFSIPTSAISVDEIALIEWSGRSRGPWPGGSMVVLLKNGTRKLIGIGLFKDEDASNAKRIVDRFSLNHTSSAD